MEINPKEREFSVFFGGNLGESDERPLSPYKMIVKTDELRKAAAIFGEEYIRDSIIQGMTNFLNEPELWK